MVDRDYKGVIAKLWQYQNKDIRLDAYLEKYREQPNHLLIALFASLLPVFTFDLLAKLAQNFFPLHKENPYHTTDINILVPDFLLSHLSEPIGNGMYQMYIAPQQYISLAFKKSTRYNTLIARLAMFLEYYLEISSEELPTSLFEEALRITAISITKPDEAALVLLKALEDGQTNHIKRKLNLSKQALNNIPSETSISNPLAASIKFVEGVSLIESGQINEGDDILKELIEKTSIIRKKGSIQTKVALNVWRTIRDQKHKEWLSEEIVFEAIEQSIALKNALKIDSITQKANFSQQETDLSENSFVVDQNGSITGLSIHRAKINEEEWAYLGTLTYLKYLSLSDCDLRKVSLKSLNPNIENLNLSNNRIENIAFDKSQAFLSLHTLNLKYNQINDITLEFLNLFPSLNRLYLQGNPLDKFPKEIFNEDNSIDHIKNYLSSIKKSTIRFVREAKLILIGNGEVGKTSIRLRLLDPKAPLPKKEERTQGLDITSYLLKDVEPSITQLEEPIDFQFNIWDFGGQGRYREIQQLFLSRNSLYLFVTSYDDNTDNEHYKGFEYWMDMINGYSYDEHTNKPSPMIFVVNKIDMQTKLINEAYISEIFPNVLDFVKVSSLTNENFSALEAAIRKALPYLGADILEKAYPEPWMKVKDQLEVKYNEHYISYMDYINLCQQEGLSESETNTLFSILERIGTVIYFGQHEALKDWVILDPIWVKEAMYKVIDSPEIQYKRGLLRSIDFSRVWEGHSPEEHEHFVTLMKAYKLCFEQEDDHGRVEYIVPSSLSIEKPELPPWLQIPDIQIKIQYKPFVPAGTVSKLIVKVNETVSEAKVGSARVGGSLVGIDLLLSTRYMWRNNAIIQSSPIHFVHIKEAWEEKAIYLDLFVTEKESSKATIFPLYEKILDLLKGLNKTLSDTKYLKNLTLEPFVKDSGEWEPMKTVLKYKPNFFKDTIGAEQELGVHKAIKKLAGSDRLEEALDKLEEVLGESNGDELINLQGRLSSVKRKYRKGTISNEELNSETNKIRDAIIVLSNELE